MIQANSAVDAYFNALPDERKSAMNALRNCLLQALPEGFTEEIAYNMPSYVVPHALYPAGYHCDAKQALPFISIAAQKNFIALYHMGIYADAHLLDWFTVEYPKYSNSFQPFQVFHFYEYLQKLFRNSFQHLFSRV